MSSDGTPTLVDSDVPAKGDLVKIDAPESDTEDAAPVTVVEDTPAGNDAGDAASVAGEAAAAAPADSDDEVASVKGDAEEADPAESDAEDFTTALGDVEEDSVRGDDDEGDAEEADPAESDAEETATEATDEAAPAESEDGEAASVEGDAGEAAVAESDAGEAAKEAAPAASEAGEAASAESDAEEVRTPVESDAEEVAEEVKLRIQDPKEYEEVAHPHHEHHSEAHQLLRSYIGHKHEEQEETVPGVLHPGATGVIYCTDRAMANGFSYSSKSEWSNMGQGAPYTGPLEGASPRPEGIDYNDHDYDIHEYAPTVGLKALREAVANLYNVEYRKDKPSQYTYENVCIVPGGRAGMSRLAAVIGDVYCGYQIPEYTTYSEVLSVFKRLLPIPTALDAEHNYKLDIGELKKAAKMLSLSVIVASNPRNPTGQVIQGDDLEELVRMGDGNTTIVLDEFYSWYCYHDDPALLGKSISGAEHVNDVNEDAVVIIDGLTKGFRLPGWRVCWVVGPKNLISAISQSGSFLDGGASHPMQVMALPLLDPARVMQDKVALQTHFREKRDHMLARLAAMGLPVKVPPQATFYVWVDLSPLPAPLNNGLTFFEELLKEKTICVPGLFFDVNPAKRRNLFESPCHHFVRLSFGPPMAVLDRGLDGMERLVRRHLDQEHDLGEYVQSPTSMAFPGIDHLHHI